MPREDLIQIRRGTTTQWNAADAASDGDPARLLAAGELGKDTTTGTLKIGDGVTLFADLPGHLDEETLADDMADSASVVGAALQASIAGTAARLVGVSATRTTDGAVTAMKHNPVDATSGARAVTLADAADAGQLAVIEKTDASTNSVTLTANIRGSAGTTRTLLGQYETLVLASKADGSWWPIASHKTKAWLDTTYGRNPVVTDTSGGPLTTRIGPSSTLANQTTGINLLAIGSESLQYETTALASMGVGNATLKFHRGGSGHNVAIGLQAQAGVEGVTGADPAVGVYRTGSANVSVGVQTLWCNDDGNDNIAMGFSALRWGTSPDACVGIGTNALFRSTGTGNVGIGANAGLALTTGSTNVIIGQSALSVATTASSNIAIGGNSMLALVTGIDNTCVGNGSGRALNGANLNTFIGSGAGYTDGTTATANNVGRAIGIGFNAQAVASNVAVIGGSLTADRVTLCIGNNGSSAHRGALQGGISLADALVLPTAAPTSGAIVYSEDGALRSYTRGGTKRTVAGDVVAKAADATLINAETTVLVTTAATTRTITLPAVSKGARHVIKKVDAGAGSVTITPASGTIDGSATKTIAAQYGYFQVESDGTNWYITGAG